MYACIIGLLMIVMWTSLLVTNQVSELSTAPLRIMYHLFAEFFTAVLLLFGGYGLLRSKQWGFQLWLIANGMLLYTVIVSAGYYADLTDMAMVGMFSILQITTLLMLIISFLKRMDLQKI